MLRVTVDSTVLDERTIGRLNRAVEGLDVEFAATTVSSRERAHDRGQERLAASHEELIAPPVEDPRWERPIYETAIIGEFRIGLAVLASEDAPRRLEGILGIISSGSFPKPGQRGENLTRRQRGQFRDALIFEAHVRDGRDIFVSDDRTAFIGKDGEKRDHLEASFATRILTVDEFCESVASLAVV